MLAGKCCPNMASKVALGRDELKHSEPGSDRRPGKGLGFTAFREARPRARGAIFYTLSRHHGAFWIVSNTILGQT